MAESRKPLTCGAFFAGLAGFATIAAAVIAGLDYFIGPWHRTREPIATPTEIAPAPGLLTSPSGGARDVKIDDRSAKSPLAATTLSPATPAIAVVGAEAPAATPMEDIRIGGDHPTDEDFSRVIYYQWHGHKAFTTDGGRVRGNIWVRAARGPATKATVLRIRHDERALQGEQFTVEECEVSRPEAGFPANTGGYVGHAIYYSKDGSILREEPCCRFWVLTDRDATAMPIILDLEKLSSFPPPR